MFDNFFDWLWMALAVAVGMAGAKYIPMLLALAGKWAAKLGADDE